MLRPVRIRSYLSLMSAKGIPAEQVLMGTGINPNRFQEPDYLIESSQCQAVIGNMIRLSGDPGIGLEAGAKTDLLSLGITGYALVTCRAMRETLDVWAQYSATLLGIMSKYEVENDRDNNVVITFVEPVPTSPVFAFCVEELLALTCKIGEIECGIAPEFLHMEFPYTPPAYRQRYDKLFQCPISFNAKRASVTISKQWVYLPLLTNDDEFHRICMEHCGRILHQIKKSSPIAMQLRDVFLASPQQVPGLEAVAQMLGLSSRTLRRRLYDEGHSYQSLVRDFRADLAREYLLSTRMSAKEIGYLLGFDDVHSFRRAFKLWTGQTPSEFRANAPAAANLKMKKTGDRQRPVS